LYPELFRLGPITLYSYGAMIGLAMIIGVALVYRQAPREGIDPERTMDFSLAVAIAGLIGSRVVFVMLYWREYVGANLWAILGFGGGGQVQGLSIHGGLLGGVLVGGILARRWRLGFWPMADLYSRPMALGMGIGRIGCILAGCCYGVLTGGTWGCTTPYATGLRHPSQLYEFALLGIVFVFLSWYMTRPRRRGRMFALLLGGYGLARLAAEVFREGERVLLGLSLGQLVSIGLIIAGVFVWKALSGSPLVGDAGSPIDQGTGPTD